MVVHDYIITSDTINLINLLKINSNFILKDRFKFNLFHEYNN